VNLTSAIRQEALASLIAPGHGHHTRLWWQFLVFCVVGVSNTVLDVAVFTVLVATLGWRESFEPTVASMAGFAVGAANSYVWNSRVTFCAGRRREAPQVGRFVVATGIGIVASGAVFALARELWLHAPSELGAAKGIALAAGTVTNFFLQRSWVFRVERNPLRALPPRVTVWAQKHPLALLLLLATAVRIPLLLLHGYWWDIELFARWASTGAEQGLLSALRRPDMDYVGYNYVLTAMGYVFLHVGNPEHLATDPVFAQLLKLPALAGDLLCVALLYFLGTRYAIGTARYRPRRFGLAAAAVFAFNPAVLYDSAYWGQVDSLVTAAMLAAIAGMLVGRPALGAAAVAIGFLVKPQPILLVPLLVWLAWRWSGPAGLVRGVAVGFATLGLGLAYFWLEGEWQQVRTIYRMLFETGEQISVSAWNVWWIAYREHEWTFPTDVVLAAGPLELTIKDTSKLLLTLAVALVVAYLGRHPTPERALIGAAFLVFSFYMLPMKMHERYLFPILAVLAPIALTQTRWLVLYVLLSATFVLNLYAIFPFPPAARPEGTHRFIGAPADVVISAANVTLYLAVAMLLAVPAAREWRQWLPARAWLMHRPPGVRVVRGPAEQQEMA
jgi:putative flippase GtrA/Gpi18-like mannosyltransferase